MSTKVKLLEGYLCFLEQIAQEDVAGLEKAQESYGDSWKKRGGVGAFMMLARKWDRMELQVAKLGYDIFVAVEFDRRSEGILDDIRDLRRYLLLVEAEVRARGINPVHRDNADVGKTVEDCKERFVVKDYYGGAPFPGQGPLKEVSMPPLIGPNTCTSDSLSTLERRTHPQATPCPGRGCKDPSHGHDPREYGVHC